MRFLCYCGKPAEYPDLCREHWEAYCAQGWGDLEHQYKKPQKKQKFKIQVHQEIGHVKHTR